MSYGIKGNVLGIAPIIAAPDVCMSPTGHPNVLQAGQKMNPGAAISQSDAATADTGGSDCGCGGTCGCGCGCGCGENPETTLRKKVRTILPGRASCIVSEKGPNPEVRGCGRRPKGGRRDERS